MFNPCVINTADLLTWITFAILLAILVGAEIYVHAKGIRGTLVSVDPERSGCVSGQTGISVRVEVPGGKIVGATANPCGLCAGQLKVGDHVTVVRRKGGYVLALPLVARK